jgi:hypothetical protein
LLIRTSGEQRFRFHALAKRPLGVPLLRGLLA